MPGPAGRSLWRAIAAAAALGLCGGIAGGAIWAGGLMLGQGISALAEALALLLVLRSVHAGLRAAALASPPLGPRLALVSGVAAAVGAGAGVAPCLYLLYAWLRPDLLAGVPAAPRIAADTPLPYPGHGPLRPALGGALTAVLCAMALVTYLVWRATTRLPSGQRR